jgi:hypothetical protein
MVSAPHLPNKTCRIDTYYRLQNVKWILLFALFAFIAGGCAAIVLTVWFLPNGYNTVLTYNSWENGRNLFAQPDQLFMRQAKQRLLTVYDKRQKINGFYPRSAYVAQAALISSDGWAVAYLPNYQIGAEKNFEILDSDNNLQQLSKMIYDKNSQLWYFKIKNAGWRVITFPDWLEINSGTDLWAVGFGNWQARLLKNITERTGNKDFAMSQPTTELVLNEKADSGSLLLNNNGDLVGIVGANNIINGFLIERELATLLATGKLGYQSLSCQGYFVYSQNSLTNSLGFYVSKSTTRASSSTLGVGDVILEINHEVLDHNHLAEQVWLAPEIVLIKVLRKGNLVEVEVKKERVE